MKRGESVETVAVWKSVTMSVTFSKDNKDVTMASTVADRFPVDSI